MSSYISTLSQFIKGGISYHREPNPSPYILSSSPPDTTLELYVLDPKLEVFRMPKDAVKDITHAIIEVALLPNSRPKFFAYTEVDCSYTVIVTENDFKVFPQHPELQVSGYQWRALTVSAGAMGASWELIGLSKIAKSVIGPLADNNISVLCISSYQADYILVQEPHLDEAVKCLGKYFKVFSQDHKRVNDTKVLSSSPVYEADLDRPLTHPFTSSSRQFNIMGIDASKLSGVVQILLDLMFFQRDESRDAFFHISIIGGDISLVLSTEAKLRFPSNVFNTHENNICWRMITVGDQPLGFEECGIVAQVVMPIAIENISSYYVSTFFTEHCIVLETEHDRVCEILRRRAVVRNNLDNSREALTTADVFSDQANGDFDSASKAVGFVFEAPDSDKIEFLVSPDSPSDHGSSSAPDAEEYVKTLTEALQRLKS